MEIVIYLDSLFLLNFIMNYWILKLLTYQFSIKERTLQSLIAAMAGSGIYIFLLVFPIQTRFIQLIEICLSVPTMLLIVLPKQKHVIWKRALAHGFLYSFIISGILRFLVSKWRLFFSDNVHILAVLTVGYLSFEMIARYLQKQRLSKKYGICKVKLKSEVGSVCIKALLDTGNSLIEPISKKPVCLVEQDVLEQLISKENTFLRAIPYRSVGCEQGILYGVKISELQITYGDEYFVANKVICAGVGHKLSTKDAYKMILHPGCVVEENKKMERGKEDVVKKRSKKKALFVGRTGLDEGGTGNGNSLHRWNRRIAATFGGRGRK